MYYWGDNYKMQTSHTLCSRPKRYGALHTVTRTDNVFLKHVQATDSPETQRVAAHPRERVARVAAGFRQHLNRHV